MSDCSVSGVASGFGRKSTALLLLALALFLCAEAAQAMGRAPSQYNVGVRSLAVITPDNTRLGVMVWYPTSRSQTDYRTSFGMWVMRAEKNVPLANLVAPVILISHDMVDSNMSYHEISGELASAGFIVIVPSHTGDNVENASATYSAAALYFRPLQLHEALGAVLREPDFKDRLDLQRLGLLGSGVGGLTVLQMCGVDLDYDAYKNYCVAGTDDDALCSVWARNRMGRMQADMAEIRAKHGRKAFVPLLNNVKAVGLLSPGWLVLGSKSDIASLRVPVAALFAGQGGLYPRVESGEDVLEIFPHPLYDSVNYQVLVEADHYSLRSECPPEILKFTPEVCGRLSGKARKRVREKRDNYFVTFFQAALGSPLPLPGAPQR